MVVDRMSGASWAICAEPGGRKTCWPLSAGTIEENEPMSPEDRSAQLPGEGTGDRIERSLAFLQTKVCALVESESESVALRACKLYYDMLCDQEALARESTRQQGRPLRIIFRGREVVE